MKVPKRRRREHKTDYHRRLNLLKSNRSRIVFRKSNKYLISQYVTSAEAQDKIEISTNSKELLKYGWTEEFKGSLKSIPAGYLLGLLTGKKIIRTKKEVPIVDLGIARVLHKTVIFGFIKGLIDSGLNIECKKEAFPEKERIEGEALKKDFTTKFKDIKTKIEKE